MSGTKTGLSCQHLERHTPTGLKNKEYYCNQKHCWVCPITCEQGCKLFLVALPFGHIEDIPEQPDTCFEAFDDMAVELL